MELLDVLCNGNVNLACKLIEAHHFPTLPSHVQHSIVSILFTGISPLHPQELEKQVASLSKAME
eukprot:189546-Pelagomonas_calceolata.AAC.1